MTTEVRAGATVEPLEEAAPRGRLPNAADAEAALIGMVLAGDGAALAAASEVLEPDDFYRMGLGDLYRAARDVGASGPVDSVLVLDALAREGKLEALGLSRLEVLDLVGQAGIPGAAPAYARTIVEASRRRALIAIGGRLQAVGYSGEGTVADLLERAEGELFAAAVRQRAKTGTARSAIEAALEEVEAIHAGRGGLGGVPTGFADLDLLLWGLSPGGLVLVAARPGVGKSAFVGAVARNVAASGSAPVLFVSLEMSERELGMRWQCAGSGVPISRIRAGKATEQDWRRMAAAAELLAPMPIEIVSASAATPTDIRSRARRLKMRSGLGLVVIDYVQLMTSGTKHDSRAQEVAEISRSLKLLAQELDVPVLACSQLNREQSRRQDPRPQLSDLRDSGALEQDADVVLFLHQPEDRPFVEAMVAKHRNGPTGRIPLAFARDLTSFASWTRVSGSERSRQ